MQTSITSWLKNSSSAKSSKEADTKLDQERELDDEDVASIPLGSSASGISSDVLDGNQATKVEKKIQTSSSRDRTQPHLSSMNIDFVIESKPLPPNVEILKISSELLPQFKRLISVLLPVPYSASFYSEILTDDIAKELSLVAIWKDDDSQIGKVVSGIRCKLLARSPRYASGNKIEAGLNEQVASASPEAEAVDNNPSLYIATIATYAPYRGRGLASALMGQLIRLAADDYGITTVTAHVWEGAPDTREWYKKLGFNEVRYQKDYHRRLQPTGSFLVERNVNVSNLQSSKDD